MQDIFADEFRDIPTALAQNTDLREAVINLIDREPIAGKATEEADRLSRFKGILKQLVNGQITLTNAYQMTEAQIPASMSIHAGNRSVFPSGWGERLVRTQLSRFYNQAVLEHLVATNQTQCKIPHSSEESPSSECTRLLAGTSGTQDTRTMLDRLVKAYAQGNWNKDLKIPHHPHCTHVTKPVGF